MRTLALMFRKIESKDKTKYVNFNLSSKAKTKIKVYLKQISKYNFLAESSYIKLSKELDHPKKGLINIQNTEGNECFKLCLVRYLNSADHNPARFTKADKGFVKRLNFKDIKFPVKTRDIHK